MASLIELESQGFSYEKVKHNTDASNDSHASNDSPQDGESKPGHQRQKEDDKQGRDIMDALCMEDVVWFLSRLCESSTKLSEPSESTESTESTELTESSHSTPTTLTTYHSIEIPQISIEAYLERLLRYSECGMSSIIQSVLQLARIAAISGTIRCGHLIPEVSMWTFHRLFLSIFVVTCKIHEDQHYNNAWLSRTGGVSLQELNELEVGVFQMLDRDAWIQPEEYWKFVEQVRSMKKRSIRRKERSTRPTSHHITTH